MKTELIAKKLDFDKFSSIGKTTAIEYAKIYKMLLNKEILNSNLCDEIIKILSHQTKNEMLTRFLPPKYLEQKNTLDGLLKIKESKRFTLVAPSHKARNKIKMHSRLTVTVRLCFFWVSKKSCCATEISLIFIQLLPYFIKIIFKFRQISSFQRTDIFWERNIHNAFNGCRTLPQYKNPVSKTHCF